MQEKDMTGGMEPLELEKTSVPVVDLFAQTREYERTVEIEADACLAPAAVYVNPQSRKLPLRKRIPLGARVLMQTVSFLLFLVLMVSLLATCLVLDARTLVSSGGIKTILNTAMTPGAPAQRIPVRPAAAARFHYIQRDMELPGNVQIPEGGNIQIPSDVTNMDSLTDWFVDLTQQMLGQDADVSRETVENFLQESTVTDYLADKMSGYANDAINGTRDTEITTEEVVQLIRDNQTVIEKQFGLEITEEQLEQIQTSVDQVIEESDLNDAIHNSVRELIDNNAQIQQILDIIRTVTSDTVLMTMVAVVLVVLLLLCALNFYNFPGAMAWLGWACILAGVLLSAPIFVLQSQPGLPAQFMGQEAAAVIMPIISSLLAVMAPIHYGVLGLGVLLFVGSTLWRIIRSVIYNSKQPAMA